VRLGAVLASGALTDVRRTARALWRDRTFTLVVAATLALGLGSGDAVFGMTDRLLLRPLPGVHDNGRTAYLRLEAARGNEKGLTTPEFDAMRREATLIDGSASYMIETFNASRGEVRGVRADAALIYGDYFDVSGARAAAGRLLRASDTQFDAEPLRAVLSERFAIQFFGSVAAAPGRTLYLNNQAVTVLGVAAGGFAGVEQNEPVDVWLPLAADAPLVGDAIDRISGRTGAPHAAFIVRPRSGVRLDAVRIQLRQILRRLAIDEPQFDTDNRLAQVEPRLYPGLGAPPEARQRIESTLRLLGAVALLVLVISCANVANLLIIRNIARRGVVAMQRTLGASAWRIAREHVVQSLALGILGALGGVGVSCAIVWAFNGQAVGDVTAFDGYALDRGTAVFAALSAVLAAALSGIAPAALAARFDLYAVLRQSDLRHGASSRGLRSGLSVLQLALTLALGVGALLLVRTLHKLTTADTGLDARGVASLWQSHRVNVSLADADALARRTLAALEAVPGIQSAALGPPDLDTPFGGTTPVGPLGGAPDGRVDARIVPISPAWFGIFHIAPVRGRLFDDDDWAQGPPYNVVLTASLARKLFGSDDAVDRTLGGVFGRPELHVIGVVRDLAGNLAPDTPKDIVFVTPAFPPVTSDAFRIVMRAPTMDAHLAAAVRNALSRIFPDQLVEQPSAISAAAAHAEQRTLSRLLLLLSALAALMATIGLYGFIAFVVGTRRREFALRMALGAPRWRIGRLVLANAAAIVIGGTALGLGGAYGIARALQSRLFGVGPLDLVSYAVGVVLVGLVTAGACAAPAWRAVHLDPMTMLRET